MCVLQANSISSNDDNDDESLSRQQMPPLFLAKKNGGFYSLDLKMCSNNFSFCPCSERFLIRMGKDGMPTNSEKQNNMNSLFTVWLNFHHL